MTASAMARLRRAGNRDSSESVRWRRWPSARATRSQRDAGVVEFQNWAARVSSALRRELEMLPMDFVSVKSAVYRALASAGGPAGRNCEADSITHGAIVANCGP